ncbi:hypothetical protein ACFQI7_25810 [Paenibacillus allorhizosphaerae]|uniref:Uracil-DNA glycosylase-like domain-containing protein n=1 Tax=Paenibacillus allorhizosphaerae TaxID=2849866 RepID=A0ABM8VJI4_9BACL|nr:hypothetical protein [Paenibacillus allorhizosphaerae]CAG7645527.1 hypothetical protein PAECIP111802_03538 [Paenibacillus allorhizosphaerae]
MYLSEEQIDSLLSYVGYGDFSRPDIIFLANEGGLGDRSVEANIMDICGPFKAKPECWVNGDGANGYWKVGEWEPGSIERVPVSPFLRLCSRMVLALEDKDSSPQKWFQRGDRSVINHVRRFLSEGGLYSNRPGIRTALLDWRPLPRNNERSPLPYENVEQNLYLKAFNFSDNGSDNPYISWREKRIKIFNDLFHIYPVPLVLCVGDIPAKKRLAEHIWGIREFDEIVLSPSGKKIFVSKQKVGLGTEIVLSPFFGYEHMGYAGVRDLTAYIRENLMNENRS